MKGISSKRTSSAIASRKLLKPEVEKFRRERINSSLERLRLILLHWSEHQGLASRRVEKAEILEHTVTFLNGHAREQDKHEEEHFQEGYTACLQKAGDFLRNVGLNGDQRKSAEEMRAFAVQLTHLDRCIASPVPTLHLATCGAKSPDLCLAHYQRLGLLAVQGPSSLPKLSPRTHSAKILPPPLINNQALWRPWS